MHQKNNKMEKKEYISEEQSLFLRENKGLLFEYFSQVSNPKYDTHILGNIQVWIYGDDHQDFTPHCHVMLKDKSVEFEVSLITWDIINVKRPSSLSANWDNFKYFYKPFFTWLEEVSRKIGLQNKLRLYDMWDSNNPNNHLDDFIKKHHIEVTDDTLYNYIKEE